MMVSTNVDSVGRGVVEPTVWPDVWARCWKRIRRWSVPPRWAARDWHDEARAQGGLANSLARHEFDPTRGIPLEAFLYRRIVDAVWTLHRQETSFGRRAKPQEVVEYDAQARPRPDPDLPESITHALERLSQTERRLIGRLFWDESSLEDLSAETGLRREALKTRKARAVLKLRQLLLDPT